MVNVSMNKIWCTGAVKIHAGPLPKPLIKGKLDSKTERYFVKIELRRDPMLYKYDMYEFKMALFGIVKTGEFIFPLRNYNMVLEEFGVMTAAGMCASWCLGGNFPWSDKWKHHHKK